MLRLLLLLILLQSKHTLCCNLHAGEWEKCYKRWSRGIRQTELLAFMFELSFSLANAGSDLHYSLQIGFFHALSLPSNSTNPRALRQLLVVWVFRYRSEAPETSVSQEKHSCWPQGPWIRCIKHTGVSMGSPPGPPEPVATGSRRRTWWKLMGPTSEKATLINYRWDVARGVEVMQKTTLLLLQLQL